MAAKPRLTTCAAANVAMTAMRPCSRLPNAVAPRRTGCLHPVAAFRTGTTSTAESLVSEDESDLNSKKLSSSNVFTFARWAAHRNTNERYRRHITGMLKSVTWRNLTPPLATITSVTVAECTYQTIREAGLLPPWAPVMQLSDGPLEITSFALSLLLVFRTDSSYSRWTEAMEVWNRVRNTAQDLVRNAACWVRDPALLSAIVRWTLTYTHSLRVYLREDGDLKSATERLLLKHEHALFVELCKDTSSAYPQYALQVLTQAVARAGINANREDTLLRAISTLNACVGSCETILRYPIPLSYTRHTSRFMIIWLAFLPLALWDDAGWASVPIVTIISFLLLGIEEIGVQIEEPFALMPIKNIVKLIEKDVWSITQSGKETGALLELSLSMVHGGSLKAVEDAAGRADETSDEEEGETRPMRGRAGSEPVSDGVAPDSSPLAAVTASLATTPSPAVTTSTGQQLDGVLFESLDEAAVDDVSSELLQAAGRLP